MARTVTLPRYPTFYTAFSLPFSLKQTACIRVASTLSCLFRSAALAYASIKAAIRLNPFPGTLKSLHSDSRYLFKVGCIKDEVLIQRGLAFISSNIASKTIDDLYLLLLFSILASPNDVVAAIFFSRDKQSHSV